MGPVLTTTRRGGLIWANFIALAYAYDFETGAGRFRLSIREARCMGMQASPGPQEAFLARTYAECIRSGPRPVDIHIDSSIRMPSVSARVSYCPRFVVRLRHRTKHLLFLEVDR
jgi:hypothetical protein